MKPKDLTDIRFGILTAKRMVGTDKAYHAKWLCECDCGNTTVVSATHLLSGHTKSCGCLKNKRKSNKYVFNRYYGKIIFDDGNEMLFDKEDYRYLSMYFWIYDSHSGRVLSTVHGKTVHVARYILESNGYSLDGYVVDHINHDTLDERKRNLRRCEQKQNAMNRKVSKRSLTGYSGVYKRKEKFIAVIRADRILYHLGTFDSIEDAITARKQAESKYFGEYSPD